MKNNSAHVRVFDHAPASVQQHSCVSALASSNQGVDLPQWSPTDRAACDRVMSNDSVSALNERPAYSRSVEDSAICWVRRERYILWKPSCESTIATARKEPEVWSGGVATLRRTRPHKFGICVGIGTELSPRRRNLGWLGAGLDKPPPWRKQVPASGYHPSPSFEESRLARSGATFLLTSGRLFRALKRIRLDARGGARG